MDYKKEIVKIITSMAGKYPPITIFEDWVCCSAMAIQNACTIKHDNIWKMREEKYLATIKKYEAEEREKLSEMLLLLTLAFEEKTEDLLGQIFMESGCGSKQNGQFFTPYHLSELTAKLALTEVEQKGKMIINEPSVGGGGMIIGVANALKEKGINYQKCMKVTAQDLDWRSVYMAYVQLSLLGIDAEVVQGDTLSETYVKGNYPPDKILRTPKRMGAIL